MKALMILAFVLVACNKQQEVERVNQDSIDSAHVWPAPIQPLGVQTIPKPPDTAKK
jgi:hypothetical protein